MSLALSMSLIFYEFGFFYEFAALPAGGRGGL